MPRYDFSRLWRRLGLLAGIGLAATALVACGGGDDDDDNGGNGGTASSVFAVQRVAEGSGIQRCSVDSQGEISDCTTLDVAGLNNPAGIALSGDYAYIANFPVDNSAGTVLKCSIDSSGETLSNCVDSGVPPLSGAVDIAISGNRAYIASLTGNSVTSCAVGSDGSLTGCADSGATGLTQPTAIAFSVGNAYIVNNSAFVTRCTADSASGTLSACTAMTAPGIADTTTLAPYGIAMSGDTAYITSQGNDNVLRCTLADSGEFSACMVNELSGITVGSLSEIALFGNRAYLVNATGESSYGVVRCDLGQDTALGACTALPEAAFSSLAFR